MQFRPISWSAYGPLVCVGWVGLSWSPMHLLARWDFSSGHLITCAESQKRHCCDNLWLTPDQKGCWCAMVSLYANPSQQLIVTHSDEQWLTLTHSDVQPLVVTCSNSWLTVTYNDPQWLALTYSGPQWLIVTHSASHWLTVTHSDVQWLIATYSDV